jgi:hypothetical protein
MLNKLNNHMKQERINYQDVMELGFTEEFCPDAIYESHFGFPYSIITLDLTKRIYIEWAKETGFATIIRTDKAGFIQARRPIRNLYELKQLVSFFLEADTEFGDNE